MKIQEVRDVIKALGDDSRLRILASLSCEEMPVNSLASMLRLSQPNVSRHLARMRLLGLVEDRREGQVVYYRISQAQPGWVQSLLTKVCELLEATDEVALDTCKLRPLV
ncbi:MAG: winged helix-turn-helix transcriptional regulator [Candidatus Omnitrophica bacterium]|nr:winged helix-turn-helix transcriptional regulator [Candidatus Omnitrophota bacterium]